MFLLHLYTWTKLVATLLWLYIWQGRLFYNKALQTLRNNNILFTKVFQSLANSNSVHVDPELRAELQHYTTNTSYTESEINYECLDTIEAEYGIQIDRRVINSGMIALVFKGTDASGDLVIIKLKRRGIVGQLKQGCESVGMFYRCFSYLYPRNLYVRILRPFIQNIDDIIEQCDFAKEIANLRQAKEDFAPLAFIQIPTVYNHSSDDTEYIVMEYIDGTHTLPPHTSEEKRFEYMEQFGIFASYAFLYNAIQHTDLHGGNILFTPTGLGIIDYGMAIQVSEEIHEILLSIAAIVRDQPPLHEIDWIETFKDIFSPPLVKSEIEDLPAVEDMCIAIAEPLLTNIDLDELNVTDRVATLSGLLKRETTLNHYIYKIILGFSMMNAKVMILGPNYPNYQKLLDVERKSLRKAYALIMN